MKKIYISLIKNAIYLFLGHFKFKDAQATGEAFSPQKRTSSNSKHEISLLFSFVVGHFCPPESGSGSNNSNTCGSATLLETGQAVPCVRVVTILPPVEFIHSRHYCHNDIKAQNVLLGPGQDHNAVYLIDFGLACKYKGETSSFTPVGFPVQCSGSVIRTGLLGSLLFYQQIK